MRLVLADGLATQVMATLTGGLFLTAYALEIGASKLVIGLLAAIPFLGQLAQIPAVLLVERVRRRRPLTVAAAAAGRLALLAVVLGTLLPDGAALALLVLGLALQSAVGAVGGCAWNSWMRDLIPADRLGGFFSRRLFGMTLLGGLVGYGAGVALDGWKDALGGNLAYGALFGAATLAGLVGVGLLAATSEPSMPPPGARAPFIELLRRPLRDPNFRRLLMFLGPWSFAVNLASPFFTVYMIERLGMGTAEVVPLVVFSQVANLMTLGGWGRLTDRFANKSVLAACGPLYVACFLGWTFTTFPERHSLTVPLLYALHGLMGVATAGVTLATGNIALKLSPRGEATSYLALVGMVSSLAAGTAPVLGGAFADWAAARELSVTLVWTGPETSVASDLLSFQHWDFFFLLACGLGVFSLHRLASVRETGEVPNREFLRHALLSARRGLYNLSSVAGMRWLAGIPAADLMRERARTAPAPSPAAAREGARRAA